MCRKRSHVWEESGVLGFLEIIIAHICGAYYVQALFWSLEISPDSDIF